LPKACMHDEMKAWTQSTVEQLSSDDVTQDPSEQGYSVRCTFCTLYAVRCTLLGGFCTYPLYVSVR
jgi:hypothetical protein